LERERERKEKSEQNGAKEKRKTKERKKKKKNSKLQKLSREKKSSSSSFFTCSTILRICGSKPMSSMRSASSSARYPTRCSDTRARSMRSESLPGVATSRSQPRSMSRSWLTTGAPP